MKHLCPLHSSVSILFARCTVSLAKESRPPAPGVSPYALDIAPSAPLLTPQAVLCDCIRLLLADLSLPTDLTSRTPGILKDLEDCNAVLLCLDRDAPGRGQAGAARISRRVKMPQNSEARNAWGYSAVVATCEPPGVENRSAPQPRIAPAPLGTREQNTVLDGLSRPVFHRGQHVTVQLHRYANTTAQYCRY